MDFKEFLIGKKIDPQLFEKNEPDNYIKWKSEFEEMHPKSFEARKLFLINGIRRKYKYNLSEDAKRPASSPVKPVIKPKIKR